jgi:hypothetical protein
MTYLIGRLAGAAFVVAIAILALAGATAASRDRLRATMDENRDLSVQLHDLDVRFQNMSARPDAADLPKDLIWSPAAGPEAERAIQAAVLATADAQGVRLSSYGPGATPGGLKLPATAFQVEAEAPWTIALKFLTALQNIRPELGLGEMSLRPAPVDPSEPTVSRVAMRLVVFGLSASQGTTP